jgi:hypothetical protein
VTSTETSAKPFVCAIGVVAFPQECSNIVPSGISLYPTK